MVLSLRIQAAAVALIWCDAVFAEFYSKSHFECLPSLGDLFDSQFFIYISDGRYHLANEYKHIGFEAAAGEHTVSVTSKRCGMKNTAVFAARLNNT